jgi:uncharacterized protein YndB with AHSA1/START domain
MNQPTAEVTTEIRATATQIWKALTTPSLLKKFFMGADIESDFKVGSPISFRGVFKGREYEDKGEIQAADENRRLAFSHYSPLSGQPDTPDNYHLVSIEMVPGKGGTTVTLTQTNLVGGPKPSDGKMRADYEKNWAGVLAGLKKVVEPGSQVRAAEAARRSR